MVHPDYQYDPTLLPEIIRPIEAGEADVVLGSRPHGNPPHPAGNAVVEIRFQPVPDDAGELGVSGFAFRSTTRVIAPSGGKFWNR